MTKTFPHFKESCFNFANLFTWQVSENGLRSFSTAATFHGGIIFLKAKHLDLTSVTINLHLSRQIIIFGIFLS